VGHVRVIVFGSNPTQETLTRYVSREIMGVMQVFLRKMLGTWYGPVGTRW